MTESLPDHVVENRRFWDGMADQWVAAGERAWSQEEPTWGIWGIPESELQMLPGDMRGRDAIELGCGTGYVSAWMARRGARVVGVDNSARQLATARGLAEAHGVAIEFHHGNAEAVPWPDESFDFAISEYGAAIWCDPYAWIPEARRLLRPGGRLVFLGSTPWANVCTPPTGADIDDRLHQDYFALHELDWSEAAVDPGGVEFSLPISSWLRLFREQGFDLLDYREIQAPAGAEGSRFHVPAAWARRYPAEHVWTLEKRV